MALGSASAANAGPAVTSDAAASAVMTGALFCIGASTALHWVGARTAGMVAGPATVFLALLGSAIDISGAGEDELNETELVPGELLVAVDDDGGDGGDGLDQGWNEKLLEGLASGGGGRLFEYVLASQRDRLVARAEKPVMRAVRTLGLLH